MSWKGCVIIPPPPCHIDVISCILYGVNKWLLQSNIKRLCLDAKKKK
ncbi:hypothetical protein NXF25_021338 [Crotalus adamanteus]|uniref:Uncharacterized protein n=1 Tax=Crotalus adamanteus TaxID=8729 RepID=A0AAW1B8Z0_CROAD